MRFKIHNPETLDTYIEDTMDLYENGDTVAYYYEDNEDFCNLGELLNKLHEENITLKKELEDKRLDVKIYKQANESLYEQTEYQKTQLKENNKLIQGLITENKKLKNQN